MIDEMPDRFPIDFPVWIVAVESTLKAGPEGTRFLTESTQVVRAAFPEYNNEEGLIVLRDQISAQILAEQNGPGMVPLPLSKEQFLECLRFLQAVGVKWVGFDPGATRLFLIETSVVLQELSGDSGV